MFISKHLKVNKKTVILTFLNFFVLKLKMIVLDGI